MDDLALCSWIVLQMYRSSDILLFSKKPTGRVIISPDKLNLSYLLSSGEFLMRLYHVNALSLALLT